MSKSDLRTPKTFIFFPFVAEHHAHGCPHVPSTSSNSVERTRPSPRTPILGKIPCCCSWSTTRGTALMICRTLDPGGSCRPPSWQLECLRRTLVWGAMERNTRLGVNNQNENEFD